ncbi:MAG: LTA synthase family protein [Alphaproteobacteria bacterium]|nr:LTA synthase family protein [Alphaproteobacteria bacterium]
MSLLKKTFCLITFFILGILLATAMVVMFFWNRTTLDSLFLYVTTAISAGSFIRNISLIVVLLIASAYTFITFFSSKKGKAFLVTLSITLFFYTFQISDFIVGNVSQTTIYEDEYIIPSVSSPKQKRNLIVLYLESMESGYKNYDEKGTNILPNLSKIAEENFYFDDFYQLFYANATISGQVAGMCGIPHKTELSITNLRNIQNNTFNNVICYPDILKQEGYNTFFIQGSSLSFSGTKNFIKQHSFQKIEGINDNPDIIQNNKGSDWGVKDSTLYEITKERIIDLANKNNPFFITIATIDTHEPTTFLDPQCDKKYGDNRDVVMCADKMASDFIKWVQNQDFYKNTTIVVLGDHIVIGKNNIYPKKENRQIFNVIINPVDGLEPQKHKWTTLDVAPTIMEAIGFENKGFGLGRSLWQKDETLYEKYGLKLDMEFNKNSDFYKKFNKNEKEKISYKKYVINTLVKEKDIANYAGNIVEEEQVQIFAGTHDKIWTDSINLKMTEKDKKQYCLKAKFILINPNNKMPIIDLVINDRKIGKWEIPLTEKAPFEREICFDAENEDISINFQRNSKTSNPYHHAIGLKEFVVR